MSEAIASIVTALTTAINPSTLLGYVADFLPVVAGLIGFAFVMKLIRRVISGANNGKARV